MRLKKFEELNEKGNQFTADENFPTPYGNNPAPKRRQNAVVFDEFENELRDLIDGYSIFLSQEEMKDIINKVI
jgi:hypothetical protein